MSYWDFIENYTAAIATLDAIAAQEAAALSLTDSDMPNLNGGWGAAGWWPCQFDSGPSYPAPGTIFPDQEWG